MPQKWRMNPKATSSCSTNTMLNSTQRFKTDKQIRDVLFTQFIQQHQGVLGPMVEDTCSLTELYKEGALPWNTQARVTFT